MFYGPSSEAPLPVATRRNAMFLFQDPRPGLDDEALVGRIVGALADQGFAATKIGRGSSGIEAAVSVSRGRVGVAICCELNEPMCESQLFLWPLSPWFWQRAFWLRPQAEDVEAALAAIQDSVSRVLSESTAVSSLVWRSAAELAAFYNRPPRQSTNV